MKKGEKLLALIKDTYPALSVRKFAERAGVKPTTLQGIFERGIEKATVTNVLRIAHALGMTADELVTLISDDAEKNEIEHKAPSSLIPSTSEDKYSIYVKESENAALNVLNYFGQVSAGELTSLECIEQAEKINLPKVVLKKYAYRNDAFIMKVNGESMNKIIPDNSFVVCVPIEIHQLKNNDIVIYSKDNESSMKRFRSTDKAVIFSPESTCTEFYDVVLPKDELDQIEILAKVILYAVTLD